MPLTEYDIQLEKLRQPFNTEPQPVDNDVVAKFFLKQIPFLNQLALLLDKMGLSASNLVAFYNVSKGALLAAKGFQITGAALSLVNFLLIPLAFIACKIQGKQFPYSLSTGVKFIYSGALLALALIGLFVPGAAIVTGIIAASLALTAGAVSIAKHFWLKRQVTLQLQMLLDEIQKTEETCANFQSEVDILMSAKREGKEVLTEQIHTLLDRKESLQAILQSQVNKRAELEAKKQTLGTQALIDKSVGVGLSILALAFVATMFISAPVGLIGLIAVGVCAGGYIGARITFSLFNKPKKQVLKENVPVDDEEHISESTLQISDSLHQNPIESYEAIHQSNLRADKAAVLINQINTNKSESASLRLMLQLGILIRKNPNQRESILDYLKELPGFKETIPVLKSTLDKVANKTIKLTDEQMAELQTIPPVELYLKEKANDPESSPGHLESMLNKSSLKL